MKTIINFIKSRKESLLIIGMVLLSLIIHGYNMFHYPYFENDEGIYFSQGWSFLTQFKLSPYTYWYDHAPGGTMLAAVWLFLTGGLFTFGFALNSARVLMLVLHIFSTFYLFKVTKKITDSDVASLIACLFFILSPLAIYFQRRFLLDNIMTFWILLALYLLLYSRDRLWYYFLSAISFGMAVLSKENGIFFLPVFLLLVSMQAHKHHRAIAVIKWIVIVGMIISLYPLYALLKKELFPSGSMFSTGGNHVSLIGTLQAQASRGSGLPFWYENSDFMINLLYWVVRDPFLIYAGFIAFFAQGVQVFLNKKSSIIFLLTLSILAFLASGKLVINFYVIPLIPFFGMCIGYTIAQQLTQIRKFRIKPLGFIISTILLISVLGYISHHYYTNVFVHQALSNDDTGNQLKAVDYVKANIPSNKFIVIDYYAHLDLSESRFVGDPKFSNADWYWKVEFDSDIREKKIHNDYKNIDFTLLTAQMYRDINTFPQITSPLMRAVNNSSQIAFFSKDSQDDLKLPSYPISHPNGDWVALYKQNSFEESMTSEWNTYKKDYINISGQVGDKKLQTTEAENQADTLLRAALLDDRELYDSVLDWTMTHMKLEKKNLIATSYGKKPNGQMGITNIGTTTSTDQNVALSLLIAYQQWQDVSYLNRAKLVIQDIWKYESVLVKNKQYIVAGDWTSDKGREIVTINPSHLTPYAYRLFAQVDKSNNWNSVIDSSYEILSLCTEATLDGKKTVHIPPNWCNFSKKDGVISAVDIDSHASNFSYAAPKVIFNIALDYEWNKEKRAYDYLNKITLLKDEWKKKGAIYSNHDHSGKVLDKNESLAHYAFLLPYFNVIDKSIAEQIFTTKIVPSSVNINGGNYWGDKGNIYDQNWIWWGISLYTDRLKSYTTIENVK